MRKGTEAIDALLPLPKLVWLCVTVAPVYLRDFLRVANTSNPIPLSSIR